MKKNILIVAVIILILVFVSYKHGSDNSYASIRIGAVIPQTGFGAYWGSPVLKGIELAKKNLSEKYKTEVFIGIEDSQSNPSVGATAATKLLSIDKVDALYSEFSGISSAISPIAQSAGKTLMYSTFNQKISDDNKTAVKTFISYSVLCDQFGKGFEKSDTKIVIIASIGDAAPYCVTSLLKYTDSKNIKVVENFQGTDFRTLLLQNKDFNADYILPIMYEDGAFALMKQKYELKISGNIFCYKQDCLTNKIRTELPAGAVNGMVYFEVSLDEKFVSEIKLAYPNISEDDLAGASNAYQSMMALGEALHNCPKKDGVCVAGYLSNKSKLENPGYANAYFKNRVLGSDIKISTYIAK